MKDPAFPLYAQDFLVGILYMTNHDIGIYIKLLAVQWDKGKIPKKRLGFLTGKTWDEFSEELRGKFKEDDGFVWNKRLEDEREKRNRFKTKQVINGKKGGRPRKKYSKKELIKNPNENQKKPLEDEDENEDENESRSLKGGKGGKFKKPAIEEIQNYYEEKCSEKDIAPKENFSEKFFNFYESKGWMIGKNKMKNWKSAVSNWITKIIEDEKNKSALERTKTNSKYEDAVKQFTEEVLRTQQ